MPARRSSDDLDQGSNSNNQSPWFYFFLAEIDMTQLESAEKSVISPQLQVAAQYEPVEIACSAPGVRLIFNGIFSSNKRTALATLEIPQHIKVF